MKITSEMLSDAFALLARCAKALPPDEFWRQYNAPIAPAKPTEQQRRQFHPCSDCKSKIPVKRISRYRAHKGCWGGAF